jgi:hypothetical protein
MPHRHYGVPIAKRRPPAWSARAFVAIILAIFAIALVIWFALGG